MQRYHSEGSSGKPVWYQYLIIELSNWVTEQQLHNYFLGRKKKKKSSSILGRKKQEVDTEM